MKKIISVIIYLLMCAGISNAQELSVTKAQVPQQVSFARAFPVRYELSHTPGYQVEVDPDSLSKDFEITHMDVDQLSDQTDLYNFTVVPFALGKSTFTVTFLLTQDGQTAAQAAQETPVEITPVKIFNDNKWREIRPARVPPGWLWWGLFILFLAALGYVIYNWRKRTSSDALRLNGQVDPRSCDEIALSKIDALVNSGLWERKAYKLFYITLTDILREYLQQQFQTDTSADTSSELLRRMKKISVMQPLLMPLKDFLTSGDLVKFAKAEPEEAVRNKDIQILREIVRETTPKEEPPAQEKPL